MRVTLASQGRITLTSVCLKITSTRMKSKVAKRTMRAWTKMKMATMKMATLRASVIRLFFEMSRQSYLSASVQAMSDTRERTGRILQIFIVDAPEPGGVDISLLLMSGEECGKFVLTPWHDLSNVVANKKSLSPDPCGYFRLGWGRSWLEVGLVS